MPNGKPHVPGGIEVWKDLFIKHPHGKYDAKLSKLPPGWKDPDDVLEALFALCRKPVENEPLKIFMALTDMDRDRAQPLQPATVDRLAARLAQSTARSTPIFSDVADVQRQDHHRRGWIPPQPSTRFAIRCCAPDAIGHVQALIGLWQIFCRQGSIPADAGR